jgi:hypothetical protein
MLAMLSPASFSSGQSRTRAKVCSARFQKSSISGVDMFRTGFVQGSGELHDSQVNPWSVIVSIVQEKGSTGNSRTPSGAQRIGLNQKKNPANRAPLRAPKGGED